jgi:hypothetical protein
MCECRREVVFAVVELWVGKRKARDFKLGVFELKTFGESAAIDEYEDEVENEEEQGRQKADVVIINGRETLA